MPVYVYLTFETRIQLYVICVIDDGSNDGDRCPSLEDTVRDCGGRTCVRRPVANETCLQCIEGCQGELFHTTKIRNLV